MRKFIISEILHDKMLFLGSSTYFISTIYALTNFSILNQLLN